MSEEEKKVEDVKSVEEAQDAKEAQEAEEVAGAPAEPEKSVEEERQEMSEEAVIPEAEEIAKAEAEELPHQDLKAGMIVRVHEKIKDTNTKGEERERIQVFEGMIIGLKGKGIGRTMTVRKNSKGWMVEKIFPLSSPNLAKVEVIKQYRTRRAKLTFLRGKFKRKLKEQKAAK